MTVHLRRAVESDSTAIAKLLLAAFGEQEGPEIVELVTSLEDDPTAQPLLSLVAVTDTELVGHILFTAVQLTPTGHAGRRVDPTATILAPLAVAPEHQGLGIGGQLIAAGLQHQQQAGTDLIFVLGHPGYYPRFGFTPAGAIGFEAPYPIPSQYADAWMVQALRPGLLDTSAGTVRCADALSDPRYWQA